MPTPDEPSLEWRVSYLERRMDVADAKHLNIAEGIKDIKGELVRLSTNFTRGVVGVVLVGLAAVLGYIFTGGAGG